MLLKCCTQYTSKLGNSAVDTGLEMVNFHSNSKERQCQRMFKLQHNCTHLMLAKSCSKFSKQGFNSTWTENFQMFKLDLEKAEEPNVELPTSTGEGNDNPLRYSCLENPMDREAWQATVHGVAKNWTWLSDFTSLDHRKIRVPEKYLLYWLCQSLWLCGSQQTCVKFFKRWE